MVRDINKKDKLWQRQSLGQHVEDKEHIGAALAFTRRMIDYFSNNWEAFYELPDETVMDHFVNTGLLKVESFDPEKHDPEGTGFFDVEPGDDFYMWTDLAEGIRVEEVKYQLRSTQQGADNG